jgi:prepilin-type N-terminal cleavage/methylation domain-containing protein/prepilin-type processing-associated H-X9-DG protein
MATPITKRAFSLVELLVVIGIIAVLISLLLPSLNRAKRQANSLQCKSNMRQVGVQLSLYASQNRGFLYPVGPIDPLTREYGTLGSQLPRDQRWPVYVFKPARWDPPELLCPEDPDAAERHSYVLNKHLAKDPRELVKYSSRLPNGRPPTEVVVMGEKITLEEDYYMEEGDYLRLVERYRHGLRSGSNYLYMDGHVDTDDPERVSRNLDPWEIVRAPLATP